MSFHLWPVSRGTAIAALVGIVALAIWTRFAFIVIHGGVEASYHAWAMTNYFGSITGTYLGSADAIEAVKPFPTLGYPPGYPLLIAAARVFGFRDPQDLRHLQAVLDAIIGVPAIYKLAREGGVGRIFGLLVGGFYAVYPPLAVGAGLIMAEALSPLLVLLSLCSVLWCARRPSPVRMLAVGSWLGAVSLIRSDLVLVGAPVALWLWTAGRAPRRPILAVALAAGFVCAIMPWGIHNRAAHGAWVFTSTGGSVGLWEGLGALENPYGYVLNDDYTSRMLSDKGMSWHSVEADRYLRRDYLRAWREHPDFVLRVAAYRWRHILWTSEEFQTGAFLRLQNYLELGGPWLCVAALILLARRPPVWLAVLIPVAYALLSIGLVHYEPRYVRYVHLSYALAAVFVIARAAALLKSRDWMPALVVAVLALVYTAGEVREVRGEAQAVRSRAGARGDGGLAQ